MVHTSMPVCYLIRTRLSLKSEGKRFDGVDGVVKHAWVARLEDVAAVRGAVAAPCRYKGDVRG